jgi:hypothetical protein
MALDISIMSPDGSPAETVSLSTDEHQHLMQTAQRMGLDLIARMYDYYKDTHYSMYELPMLVAEMRILLKSNMLSETAVDRLTGLKDLCEYAIAINCPVAAISD